jgi:hypothetical protein
MPMKPWNETLHWECVFHLSFISFQMTWQSWKQRNETPHRYCTKKKWTVFWWDKSQTGEFAGGPTNVHAEDSSQIFNAWTSIGHSHAHAATVLLAGRPAAPADPVWPPLHFAATVFLTPSCVGAVCQCSSGKHATSFVIWPSYGYFKSTSFGAR